MADDDIKPDAEESAEEVEAVARDYIRRRPRCWRATTKQTEGAAAEPPADEAQAVSKSDAVDDDTAEPAQRQQTRI